MVQNSLKLPATVSIRAVEALFLWFTMILAFFAIFTLIAQSLGLSFQLYAYFGFAATIGITVASGILSKKHVQRATTNDRQLLLWLLIAGLITGGLTLFVQRASADDYWYLPNAVYHLEHPSEPLDFFVHSFALDNPHQKIVSYIGGTTSTAAFEYMQAGFAYIFRQEYLFIYYLVTPAFMGFLLPSGLFYLFSCFAQQTQNALLASLLAVVMILLVGETRSTFGNFFLTRIYQGKVICLSLGLYLFIALTLRYFREPTRFYWLALFTTITGMVGLTASTLILFPPLAIVLLLALLVSRQIKFSIGVTFFYGGTFVCLLGYALFIIQYAVENLGVSSPVNAAWPTTFWGHARFFYDPQKPTTILVVILSTVAALGLSKKSQRLFFGVWIVAVVCLYLNPIVAPFLIRYVTSPNIYWRMFYLYPFPLLLGVTLMELLAKVPVQWRLRTSILALLLLCLLHFLPFSSSAFRYRTQFALPHYKLPEQAYNIAKAVVVVAPPGAMLAPPDICGIIPMLSSAYPQIRIREIGERLWFEKEEAELRIQASNFVESGEQALFPAFRGLLGHPTLRLRSIVMKSTVFQQTEVKDLLTKYNFIHYQSIHDYVVLWQ